MKISDWENILAKHISGKGPVCRIYKDLTKLNNKKTNEPIKLYGWQISTWKNGQYYPSLRHAN